MFNFQHHWLFFPFNRSFVSFIPLFPYFCLSGSPDTARQHSKNCKLCHLLWTSWRKQVHPFFELRSPHYLQPIPLVCVLCSGRVFVSVLGTYTGMLRFCRTGSGKYRLLWFFLVFLLFDNIIWTLIDILSSRNCITSFFLKCNIIYCNLKGIYIFSAINSKWGVRLSVWFLPLSGESSPSSLALLRPRVQSR